ncbi:MAG: MFS transporter [Chitinophagaceae bacterium]|nr:MFS transporter [Chitinophagaceae bacterium]
MSISRRILPIIVFSQFCCTSLWFAGNAVIGNLVTHFQLQPNALGHLTSAVQLGFIAGTLLFALLTIADRYPPSRVFFISALAGALCNAGIIFEWNGFSSLMIFRFFTGFFLAGIYPVGMKIAADYFDKGLGRSLGFLVGALVLGTAFPHLLRGITDTISWTILMVATSSIAAIGGLLMFWLVPNGPFRKPCQKVELSSFLKVFNNRSFRSAAFGYFGHMWELYAFWTFVPVILLTNQKLYPGNQLGISLYSFLIIGSGGLACIAGGYLAQKFGTKNTAGTALFLSGLCCVLSPLFIQIQSSTLLVCFMIFWGMVVIADSPLFSTLVAQQAKAESKGTALTIVNCIGFAITIISIQLLNFLQDLMNPVYLYMVLAAGPLMGLLALYGNKEKGLNQI